MKKFTILASLMLAAAPYSANAAIIVVDESNSPYEITQSISNQNDSVLVASPTYPNSVVVNVADGLEFNNNTATGYEGLFYVYSARISFAGNNKFNGNNLDYHLFNSNDSEVSFGDNTEFKNNNAGQNLISIHTPTGTASFGNNIVFADNNVINSGKGGIIQLYYYFNDLITFGNNIVFDNNNISNGYGGGIIGTELSSTNLVFGDNIVFSNNTIDGGSYYMGGVMNIDNLSSVDFNGNTSFINNKLVMNHKDAYFGGVAVRLTYATMNFNLNESGQVVLFKDNYFSKPDDLGNIQKKLNSIYLEENATINMNLAEGTYVDIRDPIESSASATSTVNKNGEGHFYLWGDNSEFRGNLNINEGTFALMFDENDSEWAQRNSANLNNTNVNFADNTVYRPRVSNSQLASLNSANTTVGSNVVFLPFDVSKLGVGQYVYGNDYYKFEGWESALAKVDTKFNSNTQTEITIKSGLAGYQGLSALADIYRQRDDLSFSEREELDYIFYTGNVTDNIREMFEVLEGDDYINYEQVHRASVRQFNRQVISRIQNKNCPTCGLEKGFSDQHMWFNVSHNEIKKDSSHKSTGYRYDPNGFAFGYDHDFMDGDLNMGLAFSYATGEAKTSSASQGLRNINDIDEYLMSFYGKYKDIRPYVSWNTGMGLMRNKTKFQTASINTRAEYDTHAFFANVETGYDLGTACTKLEPYIGLEYTRLTTEGYSERGVGARRFDRMTWDIVEIPVGVRTSHDFYVDQFILTPALDLAYARNVGDANASTTGRFVGNPGQPWSVSSATDKRDSFRSSINFKINNLELPFAFNFGYALDYRSDYSDQQVYGTLRWDF